MTPGRGSGWRVVLAAIVIALGLSWTGLAAAGPGLERLRASGKLVWAGDQEGGGPYIYPRDDDASQVTGFEVELAARLGDYLKLEPVFYQGNWDRLPDYLKADKIDIVLNGFEWTPLRAELMEASMPYYVYALALLARSDDDSIRSWDDVKQPRDGDKRKVGVLNGSAAHELAKSTFGDAVEIVTYDGNTDAMREVENRKLDATIQDTPIASFYLPRFAKLHSVGEPRAKGYYVIFAREGERDVVEAINEALILMIRNGDLERIYRKYGIWDEQQAELSRIAEAGRFFGYSAAVGAEVEAGELPPPGEVKQGKRKRGWDVVTEYAGVMLASAGITVVLSAISFPLAILIGLLIAVGRLYGPGWLRGPLAAYVEFLRGTPLMLQLYFIFFFLPELGINIPAFATAIIGLAVNYSAYESEIYRAGIQAIPPGQMEAALSLGMTRGMAIRRIIVPQAVRIVVPPVMNDFIALFKDTSVCSVVTIVELTKRYSVLSLSTQATIELMIMTAVLYLAMSYPMSLLSRRLEDKMGGAPQPA